MKKSVFAALVLCSILAICASGANQEQPKQIREPDVIYVPTPENVVDKMLELAKVKKTDLVYDLGCGDGRIVVTAAKKFGCKAVGYDINPQRIKESNANVLKNNVGNLVTIKQEDIFTLNLSDANVITLYLLPSLNVKLIPQLEKLKPGSRIVSHDFDMAGVTPDQVVEIKSEDGYVEHTVYLWTTPLKKVTQKPAREPDVIFVPTPQEVVEKMLEVAQVKKTDLVYDLGCGDGRIVVTAAKKYGSKAVGYDIDPDRIKESNDNVAKNNVGDLVTIKQEDIFTLDLSNVNVVTLYLLPSLNVKLIPQLEKLKPGSRIVSHDFDMEGVVPDRILEMTPTDSYREHTIYLWTVPLKKEGKRPAVEKIAEGQSKVLRQPDVVFVPTPQNVVDKMLEMAKVKKTDLLYDLGCGDGRIVVTAAQKYGCKAVGFDIDPERIKESNDNVAKNKVGDLVTIKQEDIFTLDLSNVNVVTLYLLPSLNVKLIPQLEKLKPGSRIVSHDFDMKGVIPDEVITITPGDVYGDHKVYLWTTPLKKEK